jgi:hypothetical protein
MRILVINSKGGTGKTTFALNIALPYLHKKGASNIQYWDVDIANKEALNINSELFSLKVLNPEELKELRIPKNTVLDVGGNINALQTLELLDATEKIRRFDVVVIPLAKGEQDATNAVEIYNAVKNTSFQGKFIFALSSVVDPENYKREFFEFFGATSYPGKVEQIAEEDRNIFIVPYSTEIRRVKTLYGVLPYEFYLKNINKLEDLVKKLMEIEDKLDELDETSEEYKELEQKYNLLSDRIYSTKQLEKFFKFTEKQYNLFEG